MHTPPDTKSDNPSSQNIALTTKSDTTTSPNIAPWLSLKTAFRKNGSGTVGQLKNSAPANKTDRPASANMSLSGCDSLKKEIESKCMSV